MHFSFVIIWPWRWVSESQNPYHFISYKWKQACFYRMVFNSQCLGPNSCRPLPLTIQASVQIFVQSAASLPGTLALVQNMLSPAVWFFAAHFQPSPLCLPMVLIFFFLSSFHFFGFTTGRTGASALSTFLRIAHCPTGSDLPAGIKCRPNGEGIFG